MQKANDFLAMLDGYIGGHPWLVIFLLGAGVFLLFTLVFLSSVTYDMQLML